MRVFSCQVCGQRVYFDNVRCERCRAQLGYLPNQAQLHALWPVEADQRRHRAVRAVPKLGRLRRLQLDGARR